MNQLHTAYFEKLFLFFIITLTTIVTMIFFPLIALMLSSIMTASISSMIEINIPPSIIAGIIIGVVLLGYFIYEIKFTEYGIKFGNFSSKKFIRSFFIIPLIIGFISNQFSMELSLDSFLNYSDTIIYFFSSSSISINPEITEYFSIVGAVLGIAILTLWFTKLAIFHLIFWFLKFFYTLFLLIISI
jgi:hypothetical protein